MYYLRIDDDDTLHEYHSGAQLYELLMSHEKIFCNYKWNLYGVELNQAPQTNFPVMDLVEKIHESNTGLTLTFNEFCKVVSRFDQIINLLVYSSIDGNDFTEFQDTYEWRCQSPLFIEVMDGAALELFSKSKILLMDIQKDYKTTQLCDLSVEDPCELRKHT